MPGASPPRSASAKRCVRAHRTASGSRTAADSRSTAPTAARRRSWRSSRHSTMPAETCAVIAVWSSPSRAAISAAALTSASRRCWSVTGSVRRASSASSSRAQRRVVGRQLVERLLEQGDRVVVDLAVGLEVGEAQRGGGEGGGVAAAAGERGGLAVAPARLLDVPVGQARRRERGDRRGARRLAGRGAELAGLERLLVEAPGLRVGEHRAGLARGGQGVLPRRLRPDPAAGGEQRVVGDLGGRDVAAAPLPQQRRGGGVQARPLARRASRP